jgi:histone deacetylase-like protein
MGRFATCEAGPMTRLITHPACLEHLTPPGHSERPDRLRAIEQELEHEKFTFLLREQCPRAELEIIALCHPEEYIERIRKAVPQTGLVELADDTVLSAGSFEASLRAAGGTILAVDEVMAGKAKNAFVAIRPAGHHAEAVTAMGLVFKSFALPVWLSAAVTAAVAISAAFTRGAPILHPTPSQHRSSSRRSNCGSVVCWFQI